MERQTSGYENTFSKHITGEWFACKVLKKPQKNPQLENRHSKLKYRDGK